MSPNRTSPRSGATVAPRRSVAVVHNLLLLQWLLPFIHVLQRSLVEYICSNDIFGAGRYGGSFVQDIALSKNQCTSHPWCHSLDYHSTLWCCLVKIRVTTLKIVIQINQKGVMGFDGMSSPVVLIVLFVFTGIRIDATSRPTPIHVRSIDTILLISKTAKPRIDGKKRRAMYNR